MKKSMRHSLPLCPALARANAADGPLRNAEGPACFGVASRVSENRLDLGGGQACPPMSFAMLISLFCNCISIVVEFRSHCQMIGIDAGRVIA